MMTKKPNLLQIVDSIEYVESNCWQKQLRDHISLQSDVHQIVTLSDIKSSSLSIPDDYIVLSTVKMRNVFKYLDVIERFVCDHKIYVYDQDPWESFIDQGTLNGSYEFVSKCLNVASFVVTSKWWANFLYERGYSSKFVKMWPCKANCVSVPRWSDRPVNVGFMGQLHDYRRNAIDYLFKNYGVSVECHGSKSYNAYLDTLTRMKFFFHSEAERSWTTNGITGLWTIDGIPVQQNALWAKDIEVAARGCIAIRKYEDESIAYDVDAIPTIATYRDMSEIPAIIEKFSRDARATNELVEQSVEFIRSRTCWFDVEDMA